MVDAGGLGAEEVACDKCAVSLGDVRYDVNDAALRLVVIPLGPNPLGPASWCTADDWNLLGKGWGRRPFSAGRLGLSSCGLRQPAFK